MRTPLISSLLEKISIGILILACLLASGCNEVEQDLVINQDGTGTFDSRYELSKKFLEAIGVDRPEMEDIVNKGICLSEAGLAEQFDGDGVKVVSSNFEWKDDTAYVSFSMTFSSFSSLLETKAAGNEAIKFYRDDKGNLAVRVDGYRILGSTLGVNKLKELLPPMFEASVRITLPGMVLENNADTIEDTILSWSYSKSKESPESMTAVCEGAGLPFLATLPAGPKGKTGAQYSYSPVGKLDPFRPFIIESRKQADEKMILNPLQRYDVSQLKLVAIIWHVDHPLAMMEDATGKGFIVSKGTEIGRNDGVVTMITEKEVVIAEKAVNLLGETKTKEVRVSLHQEEREHK